MSIFIIIWSIWFLSEIVLNRFMRSGKTDKKNQDKGTIRMIWLTIGLVNTLGILASIFIKAPIDMKGSIPYVGLAIILFGMLIRFTAVASLGRLFTVDVTIREDHKVKNDGIYRIVRHPSYSGSILSFIGFGLSLNNWLSLIIISVLVTFAMLRRIKVEEKILLEQFGEEYVSYLKRTKRLIPWIY